MNAVVMASGSAGGERTTFVGVVVPKEVKVLRKGLAALPKPAGKKAFTQLLRLAVGHIKGEGVDADVFAALQDVTELSQEAVGTLFSALCVVLRLAFRVPQGSTKKEAFAQDLEHLQIPAEYCPSIVKAVFGPVRASVTEACEANGPKLPKVVNVKWRVDVSISTSALKRALKPSVLMQLTLSDGTIETFELSMDQFHALRYNTAFVLKEMTELEKKNVMLQ